MSTRLLEASHVLRAATSKLRFSAPVAYVYRPLEYAASLADAYVMKFGKGNKEIVFVGMNPGPFGMAQTGVPFGEVSFVRDWMKLDGRVDAPAKTHPKRPVLGFASARSEVSGHRLWGAFAATFPRAEDFFERAYVLNFCPLLFLGESGANLTPDKLSKTERARVEAVCETHLREALAILAPRYAVGVGAYATRAIERLGLENVQIATMPHPSPASPLANRGWDAAARLALEKAGIRGLIRA